MSQAGMSAAIRGDRANVAGAGRGWLTVFLAALILFATTANRGAQWQDSGFHILRIVTGESVNPLGLALSHPLHHWLGRLVVAIDLLEPCFAITLISALFGAVAVANTYGCVLALSGNQRASLLAAVSLGLANTFWKMATVAEVNTLTAALLSAECWCLVAYATTRRPRCLCLMSLFNGLGIANHMLASLTTPVLVVVIVHAVWKKHFRVKHLVIGSALWLAGSAPYGCLVLAELIRSGDFAGTIHSALFGHTYANRVLNLVPSPRLVLVLAGFVLISFPNLLLPAAAYGIVRAARFGVPALSRRALLAGLIIHACFVVRYHVVDQHTFLIPSYVLVSIFGGIGFAVMDQRWRPRARRIGVTLSVAFLALTPIVNAGVPTVARRFNVLQSVARGRPYRDDYVYLFIPWSVVEDSAERVSRQAVALAGHHGLILVEDTMAEFAIRYRAIRDGFDDLHITCDITQERIREAAGGADAIVLVPANADAPRTDPPIGSWKRVGDLYVLEVERCGRPRVPDAPP